MARTQAKDYDEKRQNIVDQAADLFAEQGFHSSSLNDLARACNSSKALIYHYFESKEAVLLAVVEEHVRLLYDTARDTTRGFDSAEEKLARLTKAFMRIYQHSRARHIVLSTELRHLSDEDRERVQSRERAIIDIFRNLIAGVVDGPAPEAINAPALARLFMGMINWTYTWYEPGGALDSDAVAEYASRIFIAGLKNGDFADLMR